MLLLKFLFYFIQCFVIVLFLAKSAGAQQQDFLSIDEPDFFAELPVILTATRLKQPKNKSPVAVTVIDREMIDASGFTEIADLLRLAPGMLVNYDSGHAIAAGYQFLFNRYTVRMQILVDGRSVYTSILGEMPWSSLGITIDDIERIEVIRGPSSSSYGPNAMTGVISIITRDAIQDSGVKFKINNGRFSKDEKFIRVGDHVGQLDYRLSLATRKDDGFDQRFDGKDLSIANFRGDYQLNNKDSVTFHAAYNSGDYDEDNVFDAEIRHVKKVKSTSQQLKWTRVLNSNSEFTLNYYQQDYEDNNVYNWSSNTFTFLRDDSVFSNRKNIEFTHSLYSDDYNLSWGLILRKDEVVAPQFLYQSTDNVIHTRQAFVNSQLHLNKHNIINIGLLADDNDTGAETWSPRISLNHLLNDNHTVRLSYSRANRNPFVFEEYTNWFVPNAGYVWTDLSDLGPEKIESYDIGYLAWLNDRKTELDLRVFKSRLTELMYLDETLGTGGYYQGDAFDITGFESSVSHQYEDTRIIANFAVINIEARNLLAGNADWLETGAPQRSLSFLAMHKFTKAIHASLAYYYTDSYQQLCCESQQQGARRRLDFTLSRRFKMGDSHADVKLVLQNITDDEVTTLLLNNYQRQGYISLSVAL